MARFVAPIRRRDTAKGHHYVDATGPHSRLRYDGRRYLGLPRNPAAG